MCLIEMGAQFEGELRAFRIPNSVVICSLHSEGVMPRWNVGVVRGAARPGVGPIVIESIELIAVADFLGSHKA
jgi:hypothetical protein